MTNKKPTENKQPGLKNKGSQESTKGATIDPLLESLVFLTSHYGRAKSAEALKAGLAYDEKGMGPNLFCEAANRLGLKTRVVKKKELAGITEAVLPAVLILNGDQACVLLALGKTNGTAKIYVPETGGTKQVKITDLKKSYTGYVIYTHPRAEFSDPGTPQLEDMDRHWFWATINDNRGIYGRVMIGAIMVNLFALTSPLFIMNVYDRVIPNNAMETGWVLAIGALAIYGFDFVIRTLRGYFIDLAGRRVDVVAGRRIFDQVMNMKMAGKPQSSGAFANMLRDFDSVRDFITSATMTGLVDLPFTLFFLLVIYMIAGPVAFMLFSLILIVVGAGMLLQISLKAVVSKSMHTAEAKHGLLIETINGLETIKAISADGRLRARYGNYIGENAAYAQKARFLSGLGINIATFLQQSATIIIVLIGMYMVRDSELTMGALIATVILGGRAIAPVGQVANLVARYHQARGSLKTLNDIMSMPVERPPHKQFLNRPSLQGKITFDKVSFTYPETQRKILDGVSFNIEAGERVGLIGRIGSGKSTIARLMLGLYDPEDGAIYADDTDYRQIDPADLRRNMGYIAQDVVLFRGSVRENMTVSLPQATEEDILAAAKASGVDDFVSRHPMGYDAPVGERGEGLSGGQRQAIALARAMLLQPNIMVCDEPTNAMDMQAEEAFTKHIKEQVKDKTFVLITHRHHLLALVDRLILIDQGRIVADGPRDKVIEALSQGKIAVPKNPQEGHK